MMLGDVRAWMVGRQTLTPHGQKETIFEAGYVWRMNAGFANDD